MSERRSPTEPPTERDLLGTRADRLLSGGKGPSVQEKEAILARVLAGLPAPSSTELAAGDAGVDEAGQRWWRLFRLTPLLTAAACAVLFFALGESERGPGTDDGALRARGGEPAAVDVELWVACGGAADRPRRVGSQWSPDPLRCRAGDDVLLRIERRAPVDVAVALFSEGRLTWLLPDAYGRGLPSETGRLDFVLPVEGATRGAAANGVVRLRLLAAVVGAGSTREALRPGLEAWLETGKSPLPVVELTLEVPASGPPDELEGHEPEGPAADDGGAP